MSEVSRPRLFAKRTSTSKQHKQKTQLLLGLTATLKKNQKNTKPKERKKRNKKTSFYTWRNDQ